MDTPVDNVLGQWQTYLTNISSNLMELSDQIEFQLIKARAKDTTNGYIGITKARAEQCLDRMGTLWHQYALLSEVIEKAIGLNNKRSLLYNPEDDIRKLLNTTSIVIEKEHIDINERNLISDETSEKTATPSQLLKYMQDSFGELCKEVEEISHADETVGSRLSNIKTDIAKLNSTARQLGIANVPVFDLDKVSQIERDPIKGSAELDKLVYSLEKYRASLQSAEREYKEIVERFNKIEEMLSELRDLAVKSKAAAVEAQKIFEASANMKPVIEEAVLKSLQDWLQVLKTKLSEGSMNAVKVGVSRLEQECLSKLQIERENCCTNSKDYNEWLDLKGQFKVLLVKADIVKTKNPSLNMKLNELIDDARAALFKTPVKLDDCRRLVRKLDLTLKG